MKKKFSLIYISITISLLTALGILYYSSARANSEQANAIPLEYQPDIPQALTVDVPLPQEISFAGEKVPLHRIDVQEALRKELIVNTYLHSHTIQLLRNAPRIFARIEPILKEQGIPEDFKYLAVIESNLNPLAVSPAGAVGIWQFMPGTAREVGLEVNNEIDERYNLEKSTLAAAAYLQKAYDNFGTWTLAAASYNAGNNMIRKQMGIQKENDYYDLLLGEETERYVFRILALKEIMSNPQLYHFNVQSANPIEKNKKVKVHGPIESWADFAHKHKISYKTLKRFNPWLRKSNLKNHEHKVYEILIPAEPENYR